jgi:hypothetical protein
MDLANIKPVEKEYEVVHPATDEPTGLVLTLACVHDERVKAGIREANDWLLKKGKDATKADEDEHDNRIAAAYIVDVRFERDAVWNGKTPAYSKSLALEIASNPAIKQQMIKETARIKDFYKA